MRELECKVKLSPIAILINSIWLLGIYSHLFTKLETRNIDGSIIIKLLIAYILTANTIRLLSRKKIIRIYDNAITYNSMFGWKNRILVDRFDRNKLSFTGIRKISRPDPLKQIILDFFEGVKTLFNVRRGYSLCYDGRLVATGLLNVDLFEND